MDNGGSGILGYKVRFESQAGNLTSVTVGAEGVWGLQELLVRRQILTTHGSVFKYYVTSRQPRAMPVTATQGPLRNDSAER